MSSSSHTGVSLLLLLRACETVDLLFWSVLLQTAKGLLFLWGSVVPLINCTSAVSSVQLHLGGPISLSEKPLFLERISCSWCLSVALVHRCLREKRLEPRDPSSWRYLLSFLSACLAASREAVVSCLFLLESALFPLEKFFAVCWCYPPSLSFR